MEVTSQDIGFEGERALKLASSRIGCWELEAMDWRLTPCWGYEGRAGRSPLEKRETRLLTVFWSVWRLCSIRSTRLRDNVSPSCSSDSVLRTLHRGTCSVRLRRRRPDSKPHNVDRAHRSHSQAHTLLCLNGTECI